MHIITDSNVINIQPQRIVGFGFAAIVLILLGVAIISVWRLHAIEDTLSQVVYDYHRRTELTSNMQDAVRERLLKLQGVLSATDIFERDALAISVREQGDRFLGNREQLLTLNLHPEESMLLIQQAQAAKQAGIAFERAIELDLSGSREAARAILLNDIIPLQDQVLLTLEQLSRLQSEHIRAASEQAQRRNQRTIKELITMTLLGVSLSIGIGWRAVIRILRMMRKIQRLVRNLHRTSQRERAIRRNMLDGVIIAGADGVIRHANLAAEALLGYPHGALIGQRLNVLMPEPHRTAHDHYIQHYLDTGETRIIGKGREVPARRQDGSLIPVELGVVHLRQDGEDMFVGFLHDIHLRKENERLLNETKEQLEAKVKVRTQELESTNARLAEEVKEREEAQAQLILQASHDPLTGLPNRRLFQERIDQAEAAARRHQQGLALFYLDLDGFKAVNDRLGHHAGDELLKTIAARLRQALRQEDVVARLGGDEFAVLISHTTEPELLGSIATKLITAVAQPVVIDQQSATVGVSIGIARYPQDATEASTLLRSADQAMYQAKNAGRGQYRFSPASMIAGAGQD